MTVQQKISEVGEPQRLLLLREHYLLLQEAGALDQYRKTEFIDGEIYVVNAHFSHHSRVQTALLRRLADAVETFSDVLIVTLELSVDLPSGAMPQPDLVVARNLPDNDAVPASDVLIAVEVSSTTQGMDLKRKPDLYASADIAEYWVADLDTLRFHQFFSPVSGAYQERNEVAFGHPLTSVTIPDLTIATDGLA